MRCRWGRVLLVRRQFLGEVVALGQIPDAELLAVCAEVACHLCDSGAECLRSVSEGGDHELSYV